MSKVDQSQLRIIEVPPIQYPKSHITCLNNQRKKAKEEEETTQFKIGANQGINPSPPFPFPDTLTTRPGGHVVHGL